MNKHAEKIRCGRINCQCDQCQSAAEIERLEAENTALRQIISQCVEVLGNGSHVAPDASLDFMRNAPGEVDRWRRGLEGELTEEHETATELRGELVGISTSIHGYYRTDERVGVSVAKLLKCNNDCHKELAESKAQLEKLKDPACVRANMLCEKIGMLPEVLECPKLREELAAVKGQLDGFKTRCLDVRDAVNEFRRKPGDQIASENLDATLNRCNQPDLLKTERTYTAEEVGPLVRCIQLVEDLTPCLETKTALQHAARLGLVKEGVE